MNSGASLASRLDSLFAAIDSKDTAAFLDFLTDDAAFRFGSNPELCGHAAIRTGVDGFFASIAGSKHTQGTVLQQDSTMVIEGDVRYTRHDGTEVTLPFTNIFELAGEHIARYKIYIDIAPLYAE